MFPAISGLCLYLGELLSCSAAPLLVVEIFKIYEVKETEKDERIESIKSGGGDSHLLFGQCLVIKYLIVKLSIITSPL